jgi:hypothetical protein
VVAGFFRQTLSACLHGQQAAVQQLQRALGAGFELAVRIGLERGLLRLGVFIRDDLQRSPLRQKRDQGRRTLDRDGETEKLPRRSRL